MEAMEAMEAMEGRNELLWWKKWKMKKGRENVKMTLQCHPPPSFICNPSILLFSACHYESTSIISNAIVGGTILGFLGARLAGVFFFANLAFFFSNSIISRFNRAT